MIARQYAETNARSDRALVQSEETLRLYAAALEQLSRTNEMLGRLAELAEGGKPQASARSAGAPICYPRATKQCAWGPDDRQRIDSDARRPLPVSGQGPDA
ncbi:MAG: hypothetical protein AB1749_11205 [Pseudomonadota bacterium]